MRSNSILKITVSALLIAIGIVIPMFMPIKVVLEPASFTLASHVAIFIAMMISPAVAISVAVGTTLGFFIGGFPIVIVLRAATHIGFAALGACYLQQRPACLESAGRIHFFSFATGILHGLCELIVVSLFYFGGNIGSAYYEQGFARSVLMLVGAGSVIHSMVDFEIALMIQRVLSKQRVFSALQS